MRNVVLQIDVSVDGFVADANDHIGWVTDSADMNQEASDLLATADTILLGRVAYQMFVEFWPGIDVNGTTMDSKIARRLNAADKIIFSKTLNTVEWGKWNNARLVKDNIADEIARLKALPGQHMLLYAGASIAFTFMQLGLIDEYRLRVHPVILGVGKPLFQGIDRKQKLNLVNTKTYSNGAVLLHYLPQNS